MSIIDLGPLDWRVPIVTPEGRPTQEFQRRWANQNTNNNQIGGVTIGSGPPTTPNPNDGDQYVDTSTIPYTLYVGNGGVWGSAGISSANPTAIAKDTAINGTAQTFMRSDAAPAIQKADSSQFGIVKVDGTTITSVSGVISSSGGSNFGALVLSGVDTTISTSAFASKGNRLSVGLKKLTLSAIVPTNSWVNTFNYYCVVGIANNSGVVTSLVGTTTARTGITTGLSSQVFNLPSPVVLDPSSLTTGQSFFVLLVCTNGTGGSTYILPSGAAAETATAISGTFWKRFGGIRAATIAPTVGTTLDVWASAGPGFGISFFGAEA